MIGNIDIIAYADKMREIYPTIGTVTVFLSAPTFARCNFIRQQLRYSNNEMLLRNGVMLVPISNANDEFINVMNVRGTTGLCCVLDSDIRRGELPWELNRTLSSSLLLSSKVFNVPISRLIDSWEFISIVQP